MCNRFRQTKSGRELAERFQAWEEIEDTPRFNIAPTQPVLAVRDHAGKRMISSLRREGNSQASKSIRISISQGAKLLRVVWPRVNSPIRRLKRLS